MTTDPTSPQSLPEVAQLAIQNRRDITALSETFSGFAERITAAHERMAQALEDLIQDGREQRVQFTVFTDGLNELRSQVADLTSAQQRTDASVAALTEAQQQTNDRVTRLEEQMSALTSQVSRLTEAQQQTNDRVTRLEEQMSALTSQVSRLTEAQQQTNDRVTRLEEQMSALTSQVSRLTEAQQQTNDRVTRLEEQMSALTGQVSRLTAVLQQTNDRMARLSGRVANLSGGRYEKGASRLARRRIRRLLNLTEAMITHTEWEPGTVLYDAVDSEALTESEAEDLDRVDLVITGHDEAGNIVHTAVEISVTIEPGDVTRSARRAAILRKASSQTVHAAVVGSVSTPEVVAMAESRNVIMLTIPAPADEN